MVVLCYITPFLIQARAESYISGDDDLEKLSPYPPSKQGAFFEPVIFEPKTKIRLGRSTYKVTIYGNFTSSLYSFRIFYYFL